MTRARTFAWFAVAGTVLASAVGAAPGRDRTPVSVETAADGTEIVVVSIPGATQAALRWVVRSGGNSDPIEKVGLAHLVEHAIFQGSYATDEHALFDSVRAQGGTINGATGPASTVYLLDAPRAAFPALAAQFIGVITNPALTLVDLERERGVVGSESALRRSSDLAWVVDGFLFPSAAQGFSMIGTRKTRDRIKHADLVAFYGQHYVPENTTVVVAGDFTPGEVRQLIEQSSRLAPVFAAPEPVAAETPNVPMTEKGWAPLTLVLLAYLVDGLPPSSCRELSDVVQWRLESALRVARPSLSELSTECFTLRGHQFLMSAALSGSSEASNLGEEMRAVFRGVARQGPSASEIALIREHNAGLRARIRNDPAALAEMAARLVTVARTPAGRFDSRQFLGAQGHDGNVLRAAAERHFVPRREMLLHLSPFIRS